MFAASSPAASCEISRLDSATRTHSSWLERTLPSVCPEAQDGPCSLVAAADKAAAETG